MGEDIYSISDQYVINIRICKENLQFKLKKTNNSIEKWTANERGQQDNKWSKNTSVCKKMLWLIYNQGNAYFHTFFGYFCSFLSHRTAVNSVCSPWCLELCPSHDLRRSCCRWNVMKGSHKIIYRIVTFTNTYGCSPPPPGWHCEDSLLSRKREAGSQLGTSFCLSLTIITIYWLIVLSMSYTNISFNL